MSLKAFRVTALFAALAFASTSFAEGDLDTTFAGVGWTTIALGTGALYESRVLPDGKIVVGTTRATRFMPAVARLLADGTPDPTFGNQGPGRSAFDMTAFGFGFGGQHTAGFTVSPDGSKIYLSGRAYGTSSCPAPSCASMPPGSWTPPSAPAAYSRRARARRIFLRQIPTAVW